MTINAFCPRFVAMFFVTGARQKCIWVQDGDTAMGLSMWILVFMGCQIFLSMVSFC